MELGAIKFREGGLNDELHRRDVRTGGYGVVLDAGMMRVVIVSHPLSPSRSLPWSTQSRSGTLQLIQELIFAVGRKSI